MTLVTPPSGPDFDETNLLALAYYRREPGYVVHDGSSGPPSPAPLVPTWAASTSYSAGQVVQHPSSPDLYLRRIAAGVSRGSFDATELALWKASGAATYAAIDHVVGGVSTTTVDTFAGSSLDPSWRVLRQGTPAPAVSGNKLTLTTLPGNQFSTNDTAQNVVLRPMPEGPWDAYVKITGLPVLGGQTFGLAAYVGANRAAYVRREGRGTGSTTRTGLLWNLSGGTVNDFSEVNTNTLNAVWWARLTSDGKRITGYTSPDGVTWTKIGSPVSVDRIQLGHIGVFAYDSNSGATLAVTFEQFTITSQPYEAPVIPPRLGVPTDVAPADALSLKYQGVLQNADKYLLNTLYPAFNGPQSGAAYLSFDTGSGGVTENEIRPWAMSAFSLAVSLNTGAYSQSVAVSTPTAATAVVARLVASLAYHHASNDPAGWGPLGGTGQTTMWAGWVAQAAWLVWDSLSTADQTLVYRMLVHEAQYQANAKPDIWKNPSGTELRSGDSGSDSNAWNQMPYYTALAMLPNHPNRPLWRSKLIELQMNSYSRFEDLTSARVVEGKAVSEYVTAGFNINSDGTVINHGIIHPDYSATITQQLHSIVVMAMASLQAAPQSATFNADLVYSGLVDVFFSSPPWTSPGGYMYTRASGAVYYPQTPDWGYFRRADKACIDAMMDSFALAPNVSVAAATWADLHISDVVTAQARSGTGQTYLPGDDDNYPLREQWVHSNAAMAWSARWVISTGRYVAPLQTRTGRHVALDQRGQALEMRSGIYYAAGRANTNSTYGAGTGNARGSRVVFARDCVLNSLAIKVATAGSAGSLVRLLLYKWDRVAANWALVVDSAVIAGAAIDTTTTGVKTVTINQPVFAEDTYVVLAAGQGSPTTIPLLQGTTVTQMPEVGDSSADTILSNTPAGLQGTGVTGAGPATLTLSVSTSVPVIAIRAA